MFSTPPIIEFPAPQTWYRLQRLKPRSDTVRIGGFLLAPPTLPVGRFDLPGEPTGYLADSAETALYETVMRREARSCSLGSLRLRALASFSTPGGMRIADVRGLVEANPVLVSQRYESTQAFAAHCSEVGLDGVLYASAQHPQHDCLALFPPALRRCKRLEQSPLVRGGNQLLKPVVTALRGSMVPLIDD